MIHLVELVLACLAAFLFLLHIILWKTVATYRSNLLIATAGLLLSLVVILLLLG